MLNVVQEFILDFLSIVCSTGLILGIILKAVKIFARAFSKGVLSID